MLLNRPAAPSSVTLDPSQRIWLRASQHAPKDIKAASRLPRQQQPFTHRHISSTTAPQPYGRVHSMASLLLLLLLLQCLSLRALIRVQVEHAKHLARFVLLNEQVPPAAQVPVQVRAHIFSLPQLLKTPAQPWGTQSGSSVYQTRAYPLSDGNNTQREYCQLRQRGVTHVAPTAN
jgi:hypothetical protein